MGATRTGSFFATPFWLIVASLSALGDESPPKPPAASKAAESAPASGKTPTPEPTAQPDAKKDKPRAADKTPAKDTAADKDKAELDADVAKARADAEQRLKQLDDAANPQAASANKALREVFNERLQRLKDWEEAVKARRDAENPERSPERELADCKADLEHVTALLEESSKKPAVLIPQALRDPGPIVTDAYMTELKEAIDEERNDLKQWGEKLEKLKSDSPSAIAARVAALRAERDKTHQKLATLRARPVERDGPAKGGKSQNDRTLQLEREINAQWKVRVEEERLSGLEAEVAFQIKRAKSIVVQLQRAEGRQALANRTLALMRERYEAESNRKEAALKRAAAAEEQKAAKMADPIEHYRAKRSADMLEIEAQITKYQKELATAPSPSLDDARRLADEADNDFAEIKKLLDDNRVSHLDALRLNNDFRRIGPKREAIIKSELARAIVNLAEYENALSAVEIALISDTRDDRLEYEALLERLDKARHAEAEKVCIEMEGRHTKLLNEERRQLLFLAARAEQTYDEINRRLKILEDQYGFIRTHLILVRDREPIGMETFNLAQREIGHVSRGCCRLLGELFDRNRWGRTSAEFKLAFAAVFLVPWPLYRVRRRLQRHGWGGPGPSQSPHAKS
jgi:potassium efflux system protein